MRRGHRTTQGVIERASYACIRGGRFHAYFTFVPEESNWWEGKVSKMLAKKLHGNYATRYGNSCEKDAAEAYTETTGDAVTNVGFVVHPSLPWLGYSPDGINFKKGVPVPANALPSSVFAGIFFKDMTWRR